MDYSKKALLPSKNRRASFWVLGTLFEKDLPSGCQLGQRNTFRQQERKFK
jgi:hypothetical protein